MPNNIQYRILLVDDNAAIHDDIRSALQVQSINPGIAQVKSKLFGKSINEPGQKDEVPSFTIDSAYQGKEALNCVQDSVAQGRPYALAFVDIRMPPGWDGIETIQKLWEVDPRIEIVICSAYSDYSFEDIGRKLNWAHNVLILKKPFEIIEIRQLAASLTQKWFLRQQVEEQILNLQAMTNDLKHMLSLTHATLESTRDGILVLNRLGKPVLFNGAFKKIWGIPDSVNDATSIDSLMTDLASQVIDGDHFLDVITNINNIDNNQKWRLKSGKVIELYSCSQKLKDRTIGTFLNFRDITEEEQLKAEFSPKVTDDLIK